MEELAKVVYEVEEHYTVSANDHLQIEVFTNKGEELIDPNNALSNENNSTNIDSPSPVYTVMSNGEVVLPIVGNVTLSGMTIPEVNAHLQEKYKVYYKDPLFRQNTSISG